MAEEVFSRKDPQGLETKMIEKEGRARDDLRCMSGSNAALLTETAQPGWKQGRDAS